MATDIKVPTLGESVTSATVARWMKQEGEAVAADEPLVELETDKVTVEVNAPSAGVLTSISAPEGSEVPVGALLGVLDADAKSGAAPKPAAQPAGKPAGAPAAKPVAAPAAKPAPEPRPAANPQAGVNPPPRALGPVARPAPPPTDGVAHAPLARRGKADRGAASFASRDRRRHRQGRPHHQRRRAGVPQPSGARCDTGTGGTRARALTNRANSGCA